MCPRRYPHPCGKERSVSTIGSLGGLAAYNPGVLNGVNVASPLASGAQLPGAVQGSSSAETVSTGVQATAISSSSQTMSAQMESLVQVTNALSNSDMVNALLLLLAMKLLSGDDTAEKDKKTMAALLLLAAGLGQQPCPFPCRRATSAPVPCRSARSRPALRRTPTRPRPVEPVRPPSMSAPERHPGRKAVTSAPGATCSQTPPLETSVP